ncbi:MAG: division/cell wall cluster transcriptional repressor MraZ [Acidobacteriota bacterium]
MRFRGNIPAKIDAQGRLKIPSLYKAIFDEVYGSDALFITSFNGDHIVIYPLKEWEAIEAKLRERPAGKAKRKFLQYTGYWGQEAFLDKQGRVLLHPHLRKAAGVDGTDVAVIGNLTHLAVWNDEKVQATMANDPFTDEELEQLGI